MKRIFNYMVALLACAMAGTACSDDEEITVVPAGISLSVISYTFDSGEETFPVEVSCEGTWTGTPDASWIKVEKLDEKTAQVSVSANTGVEMRQGEVKFAADGSEAVLKVDQLGASFKGLFRELVNYSGLVMSRNGEWAAAMLTKGYDNYDNYVYDVVRFNLKTGEEEVLLENANGTQVTKTSAISNDGKTVVLAEDGNVYKGYVLKEGGSLEELAVPAGYQSVVAEAASADCSVIVGFAIKTPEGQSWGQYYDAVKWVNGTPEILESPRSNMVGEALYSGLMARGCSADGSVIYGSEWDYMSLLYWKDGKVNFIAQNYTNRTEFPELGLIVQDIVSMQAQQTNISANGRYIATGYYKADVSGPYPTSVSHPALVDTEAGTMEYVEKLSDGTFWTVSNDGLCFGSTPMAQEFDHGIMKEKDSEEIVEFDDWFKQNTGLTLSKDRVIYSLSDDRKAYLGYHVVPSMLGVTMIPFYLVIE